MTLLRGSSSAPKSPPKSFPSQRPNFPRRRSGRPTACWTIPSSPPPSVRYAHGRKRSTSISSPKLIERLERTHERDHFGGGDRYAPLPDYARREQAVAADLRQADDLLSVVNPHA